MKLAPHILLTPFYFDMDKDLKRIERLQPKSIKLVDADPGFVSVIHEASPKSLIILRKHGMSEEHGAMAAYPTSTATRHAAEWAAFLDNPMMTVPRDKIAVEGINEPQVWDAMEQSIVYTAEFGISANTWDMRAVLGNYGVGWVGSDGEGMPPHWENYNRVREVLLDYPQHFLGLHEYWPHTGPRENWPWWSGRFTMCPWKVPIIIGECGVDELVWNPLVTHAQRGYKHYMNGGEFNQQLITYEKEIQKDDRIHSANVFSWYGNVDHWGSFWCQNVFDMIPTNYDFHDPWRPPPTGTFKQSVIEVANNAQCIMPNPAAALQKEIYRDGFFPTSNEVEETIDGIAYVIQRADTLEGAARAYYVIKGEWEAVARFDI